MFMGTLQPLITGLAGGTATFIFPLPASDNREPELKEEPRLPRLLRADPGNGATCATAAAPRSSGSAPDPCPFPPPPSHGRPQCAAPARAERTVRAVWRS